VTVAAETGGGGGGPGGGGSGSGGGGTGSGGGTGTAATPDAGDRLAQTGSVTAAWLIPASLGLIVLGIVITAVRHRRRAGGVS
jgi:hypothetical protein